MSYDLRRLKLKGIINRKKDSNRYHLSDFGLRTACFFTKTEKRIFSKATIPLDNKNKPKGLEKAFNNVDKAIENIINEAKLS